MAWGFKSQKATSEEGFQGLLLLFILLFPTSVSVRAQAQRPPQAAQRRPKLVRMSHRPQGPTAEGRVERVVAVAGHL